MTVREYIGARYVPLFMGEWSSENTYEPLSIVEHQGNSYTSRQAVPSGIDISNEQYWAVTGNFNAQVEQYRQEVQQLSDAVDNIEIEVDEKIENLNIEKNMQIFGAHIEGSSTLVKTDDANILIDVGYLNDVSSIGTFLLSHLGTEKLDLVVISHFHDDHAGGVQGVIPYCDSDTQVFYQMETPSTNYDYSIAGGYAAMKELCDNAFTSIGITPIVPLNQGEYNFGKTTVKMYNTNTNNIPAYENSWANNTTRALDTRQNSLNNYSLITRVEYGANVYVDCSDVEGEAQRLNAQYMTKATVMKTPHHLANWMGYLEFWNRLNPDYICLNHSYQDTTETTLDDSNIMVCYTYKYIAFAKDVSVYTNRGKEFKFEMTDGTVWETSGYTFNKNLNRDYTGFLLIPVNKYYEDPFYLRRITWNELVTVNKQHQNAFYCTFSPGATLLANSELLNTVATLFGGEYYNEGSNLIAVISENSNAVLRITCGISELLVEIADPNTIFTQVRLYNGFDIANPDLNVRRETLPNGVIRLNNYEAGSNPGWVENDSLDSNSLKVRTLLGSNVLVVNVNGEVLVPLIRESINYHYSVGSYRGCAISADGNYLYNVFIAGYTFTSIKKISLADHTVTSVPARYITNLI